MTPRVFWHISRSVAILALPLFLAPAPYAAAQSRAASTPAVDQAHTVISSTDAPTGHLWLADTTATGTSLTHRTEQSPFDAPRHFGPRLASIVGVNSNALLIFENGDVAEIQTDETPPESRPDLPLRREPIHAIGVGDSIYALVDSQMAREAPLQTDGVAQAFEPGAASVCVIALTPAGWAGVAPCPAGAVARDGGLRRPRLLAFGGKLVLFWADGDVKIAWAELELPKRTWRAGGSVDVTGLTGFAPIVLSRVPTLVTLSTLDGREAPAVMRLLSGSLTDPTAKWSDSELQLSPLPAESRDPRVTDVVAFNQHVTLAVTDASGRRFLQFGRLGEAPIEHTISLQAAFEPTLDEQFRAIVQYASLLLMVLVVTLLFVFRGGSSMRDPVLPAPWQPALHAQRLIGAAIDIIPFSLVSTLWLHVSWQDATRSLLDWASPFSGALPGALVLGWWGSTAAMYITYSTIMEFLVGRTIGKVLTGTRVLSHNGERPLLWQRLLRNVVRIAEVHPPFWLPLGMLFLITRSHQRIGDLLAKTVVVRKVIVLETQVSPRDAGSKPGDAPPDGAPPPGDSHQDQTRPPE